MKKVKRKTHYSFKGTGAKIATGMKKYSRLKEMSSFNYLRHKKQTFLASDPSKFMLSF